MGCSMAKRIHMSIPSKTNSREESKPSVEGEGVKSGQDREASAANSDSVSEDRESVSREAAGETETAEAEAAAPITSGRAPLSALNLGSNQCVVYFDPEGMMSSSEGLLLRQRCK